MVARAPGPATAESDTLGDVTGLSVVHLQCHLGLETRSFARAGAMVVGLDFSSAAIGTARDVATRAGLAPRAMFGRRGKMTVRHEPRRVT